MNGLYTYVATALIAASLAATGAWKVQSWRYDAKEKERVESQLADERLAATARVRREEQIITAQNEAQARARVLRLDADGARAALVGLSHATESAMRDAATSHDACTSNGEKLEVVLIACSRRYEEVARDADNWENDAVMLRDAWPK